MLTLYAPWVSTASYNLGLLSERFVYQAKQAMKDGHTLAEVPAEQVKSIHISLQMIERVGDDFGLVATKNQAARCMETMKNDARMLNAKVIVFKIEDAEKLGYMLNGLSTTLTDELSKNVFVAARRGDDDLLADDVRPFGSEAADAFPTAIYDVEEAARCRALYRWTACVTHLMRALEPPLLAFQASLGVNVPKANWQDILNQIDAKIKANGHKHADHAWNSEAALQFLRFMDAWRNYAMHGKDRYDEERAIAIYDSVRHFTRHLATRLSEAP